MRRPGLTSQPGTSFMISFSRARAACSLRYTSRSDSARSNGTRWIRDHARSRCNSLLLGATKSVTSALLPDCVLVAGGQTCRFSRLPCPTRQNPKVQMAATVPKMRAPPGPLVGKLRLYLIGAKPPAGGKSLHSVEDRVSREEQRRRGSRPFWATLRRREHVRGTSLSHCDTGGIAMACVVTGGESRAGRADQ